MFSFTPFKTIDSTLKPIVGIILSCVSTFSLYRMATGVYV